MSLDVYLKSEEYFPAPKTSGIFIRRNGSTEEITDEEWNLLRPGEFAVRLKHEEGEMTNVVYHANITHNLRGMADEAGMHHALWLPHIVYVKRASDLVPRLEEGLTILRSNPGFFRGFDDPGGWGTYEQLVGFVEKYLEACRKWPEARVEVSR